MSGTEALQARLYLEQGQDGWGDGVICRHEHESLFQKGWWHKGTGFGEEGRSLALAGETGVISI